MQHTALNGKGNPSGLRALAVSVAILASVASPAHATTNTLTTTGTMLETTQFTGSASGDITTLSATTLNALNLTPGTNSFSFSGSFAAQTYALTGAQAPGTNTFQDSFKFNISPDAPTGDVIAVAFNSGSLITTSNLAFRLYEAASPGAAATEGAVPTGGVTIVNWDGTVVGGAITASFSNLASGTYFLDVAGNSSGTLGGGYGGSIKLTAPSVPLPGSLPLLLSALGAVAATSTSLRRRGRRTA